MTTENWPTWLVSYHHDGALWNFEIAAPTKQDAWDRLISIRRTGKVDGELVASIPANTLTAAPVHFLVWLRNAIRRLFKQDPQS